MSLDVLNNVLISAANEKTYIQINDKDFETQRAKPKDKLSEVYRAISQQMEGAAAVSREEKDSLRERVQNVQKKYDAKCNTILGWLLTSSFIAFFYSSYRKNWEETCASYRQLQEKINKMPIQNSQSFSPLSNNHGQEENVPPDMYSKIAMANEAIRMRSKENFPSPEAVNVKCSRILGEVVIQGSIVEALNKKGKKNVKVSISDLPHFLDQYQTEFDVEAIEVIIVDRILKKEWEALAGFSQKETVKAIFLRFEQLEIESIIDTKTTSAVLSKLQVVGEPKEVKFSDRALTDDDVLQFVQAMPEVKAWDLRVCTELTTDMALLFDNLTPNPKVSLPDSMKQGTLSRE